MNLKKQRSIGKNEDGLVSFFVTIIIMIVLSLIVLGFSSISRKEQANSLDRVLSTEAFYAAESGVNDAYGLIANTINNNGGNFATNFPSETQKCTSIDLPDPGNPNPPNYISGGSNILNLTSNTKYSCLLVNPTPSTLTYTLNPGQAQVTQLLSSDSTNPLSTLDLNYTNGTQTSACNILGTTGFPPNNQWPTNCPPVLRLDIVTLKPGPLGTLSTAGLPANTESFFVYPAASGGVLDWINTPVRNASTYQALCQVTCSFSIKNLNAGGTNYPYYMRLQYVYGAGPSVSVTGYSAANNQINFSGGQIQIDSTGTAKNVVRRIQVNIAESTSVVPTPNLSIQTNSTLCKRIVVGAGFYYENIPSPEPSEAAIPRSSPLVNNSRVVPNAPNDGSSLTDPCNPLW